MNKRWVAQPPSLIYTNRNTTKSKSFPRQKFLSQLIPKKIFSLCYGNTKHRSPQFNFAIAPQFSPNNHVYQTNDRLWVPLFIAHENRKPESPDEISWSQSLKIVNRSLPSRGVVRKLPRSLWPRGKKIKIYK